MPSKDSVASQCKAVLLRTDRLGETVLTFPAAFALSRAGYQVDLIVQSGLVALARQLPWVHRVFADPTEGMSGTWRPAWRLACQLRAEKYDLALCANPLKVSHLGVRLAQIPQRVGYDRKWGQLLTQRVPDLKHLGESHEVDYNLALVEHAGIMGAHAAWGFQIEPEVVKRVQERLREAGVGSAQRLVLIHPWTSNPIKLWPLERFAQVLAHVQQQPGVVPILIGGPEEASAAKEWLADKHPVINWTGQCDLVELAALMQQQAVLISNDSGPVHLASALGIGVVALFGTQQASTGPKRWGPWGEGHQVIHKPTLEAITVNEVIMAYQKVFNTHGS